MCICFLAFLPSRWLPGPAFKRYIRRNEHFFYPSFVIIRIMILYKIQTNKNLTLELEARNERIILIDFPEFLKYIRFEERLIITNSIHFCA